MFYLSEPAVSGFIYLSPALKLSGNENAIRFSEINEQAFLETIHPDDKAMVVASAKKQLLGGVDINRISNRVTRWKIGAGIPG